MRRKRRKMLQTYLQNLNLAEIVRKLMSKYFPTIRNPPEENQTMEKWRRGKNKIMRVYMPIELASRIQNLGKC